MRLSEVILLGLALGLRGLCQPVFAQPSFQGLSDVLAGDTYSRATAVSGDGRVAVGYRASGSGGTGFRWENGEMEELGGFSPNALSRDGSVIVGSGYPSNQTEACIWTASGGVVGLGDLPGGRFESIARGVSADGSVVVGLSNVASGYGGYEAFRWSAQGGMVGLGDLPGGPFNSNARAVSADGSVIVGSGATNQTGSMAFRWTAETGMTELGDLLGGVLISTALAVSRDGSVVVGQSQSYAGYEAFRWTPSSGMVGLGDLPGGDFESSATAVSADGRRIVGTSIVKTIVLEPFGDRYNVYEAFLWDQEQGMRKLSDVLANDLGLNLAGWRLEAATGISDDGLTIVGTGINPAGQTEGWIARLPEPGTMSLMLVGVAVIRRRQRA